MAYNKRDINSRTVLEIWSRGQRLKAMGILVWTYYVRPEKSPVTFAAQDWPQLFPFFGAIQDGATWDALALSGHSGVALLSSPRTGHSSCCYGAVILSVSVNGKNSTSWFWILLTILKCQRQMDEMFGNNLQGWNGNWTATMYRNHGTPKGKIVGQPTSVMLDLYNQKLPKAGELKTLIHYDLNCD